MAPDRACRPGLLSVRLCVIPAHACTHEEVTGFWLGWLTCITAGAYRPVASHAAARCMYLTLTSAHVAQYQTPPCWSPSQHVISRGVITCRSHGGRRLSVAAGAGLRAAAGGRLPLARGVERALQGRLDLRIPTVRVPAQPSLSDSISDRFALEAFVALGAPCVLSDDPDHDPDLTAFGLVLFGSEVHPRVMTLHQQQPAGKCTASLLRLMPGM